MRHLYFASERFNDLQLGQKEELRNFGNALFGLDLKYRQRIGLEDGTFTLTNTPRNLRLPEVNVQFGNRLPEEKDRFVLFANDIMREVDWRKHLVLVNGNIRARRGRLPGEEPHNPVDPQNPQNPVAPQNPIAPQNPLNPPPNPPFQSVGALDMALTGCIIERLIEQWPTIQNPTTKQQLEAAALGKMVVRYNINPANYEGRVTEQFNRYVVALNMAAGLTIGGTSVVVDGDNVYMTVL